MKSIQKAKLLQKRKWRVRKKVNGTAERPRLSVKFSSKHIYAQAVDDDTGTTLAYLSSLDPELRPKPSAKPSPPRLRPPESQAWSSIATALVTMARSRHSLMPPVMAV
jgi:hypothetical protein